MTSPIILALDTDDIELAKEWIEALQGRVSVFKCGLEFFMRHGVSGIQRLQARQNFDLFLDVKLHDIPNTVTGAIRSIQIVKPRFLTVHASGGVEMIAAAANVDPEISIVAVTILTSLDASNFARVGFNGTPESAAVSLAELAINAGARAIVSSPMEVSKIRQRVGTGATLITPGVRPIGDARGDQKRVMAPHDALEAGADYLVIGRPITEEWHKALKDGNDPRVHMQRKVDEILSTI